MGLATFKGGVHPYEGKELSENKPVQILMPKGDMVYPMSQHIGAPANPLVKKGDIVKTGQPLLKFDMDFIKSKGYPLVTPVLIVNAEDFGELELITKASVKTGEPIYNVKQ